MTNTFKTTALIIASAFVLSACAEQKVAKSTKQSVSAEIIQVSTSATPAAPATQEKSQPETRRVCIDRITRDGRPVLGQDGKPLQDCREMRIHKRLEGTAVPPAR